MSTFYTNYTNERNFYIILSRLHYYMWMVALLYVIRKKTIINESNFLKNNIVARVSFARLHVYTWKHFTRRMKITFPRVGGISIYRMTGCATWKDILSARSVPVWMLFRYSGCHFHGNLGGTPQSCVNMDPYGPRTHPTLVCKTQLVSCFTTLVPVMFYEINKTLKL